MCKRRRANSPNVILRRLETELRELAIEAYGEDTVMEALERTDGDIEKAVVLLRHERSMWYSFHQKVQDIIGAPIPSRMTKPSWAKPLVPCRDVSE